MPWVQPVPSEEIAIREKDRDIINLWIAKDERGHMKRQRYIKGTEWYV